MLICAAGDMHGKIDLLYREVAAFEQRLGRSFSLVLQVDDLGVFPDPAKVDRKILDHGGAGDFPAWWLAKKHAPVPTIFIKGNHEDFDFLEPRGQSSNRAILPELHHVSNGRPMWYTTPDKKKTIFVAGIGGCYSPKRYKQEIGTTSPSHYYQYEVKHLIILSAYIPVDVLLLHDAPGGIWMPTTGGRQTSGYETTGPELADLVRRVRPRVCFFGHHHQRVRAQIAGVPVEGLGLVGRPGALVAWDLDAGYVGEA